MKKIISIVLSITVIMSFGTTAFATQTNDDTAVLKIGEKNYIVEKKILI